MQQRVGSMMKPTMVTVVKRAMVTANTASSTVTDKNKTEETSNENL
jgi:hypothetical protein